MTIKTLYYPTDAPTTSMPMDTIEPLM